MRVFLQLALLIAVGVYAADPCYTIWPKSSADKKANQRITDELTKDFQGDASKFFHSASHHLEATMYRYAPLNDALRKK
ncbi:hypothetical protein MMC16_004881 [Acarospora aff. strigata]|nr:hypothetical protein [Acarospora aff. strigata]